MQKIWISSRFKAYERWLTGLEKNDVDKYFFSLFIEILYEARSHTMMFLTEIKDRKMGISERLIKAGIHTYNEISSEYLILKKVYPYQEPRESEIKQKDLCISIVKKLYRLETEALEFLKEIYASLVRRNG